MRLSELGAIKLELSHMRSRTKAIASEKVARGLRYQAACRTGNFLSRAKRLARNATMENRPRQYRSGAGDRQVRPLSLCFHAKVRADFLEGHFHLPAHQEPFHDLTGGLIQIGTEYGACFKLAFAVAHHHPADGHGRQAAFIPNSSARGDFDLAVDLAIPVGKLQPLPDSLGICEDFLE